MYKNVLLVTYTCYQYIKKVYNVCYVLQYFIMATSFHL